MRTTRVNLRILAAAGCAAWVAFGPAAARADDTETFLARLAPRDVPAGTPWAYRPATAPAWMPEEALQRDRQHRAARVGQEFVADHLDSWLEGTPLEVVERLRHTDFVIAGGGGGGGETVGPGAATSGGFNVRVRLAEKVRLTVVRDDFRRDLLYDPIRGRMSMDLFRGSVGGPDTGIALTESYQVGDGASRLLLNLHHRLE